MLLLIFLWDTANTISSIGLCFSCLTFGLGVLAYKKFLVRQAQPKQLDMVLDLIKKIHAEKNKYSISDNGIRYITSPVSLFDIAKDTSFNQPVKLYFLWKAHLPAMVTDKKENLLNWQFFYEFHDNPLLPKPIADKLRIFDLAWYCQIDSVESFKVGGGILIGNRSIDDSREIYSTIHTPLGKTHTFQKAAKELELAIVDWLNAYGFRKKDINLID